MSRDSQDESLPSYDDVLKQDSLKSNSPVSQERPPKPPARPKNKPSKSSSSTSRPPASSYPRPLTSTKPTSAPLNNSGRPPANGLPWVYPSNYYCQKCGNTGYKFKNGRSCKTCWRRFAPSNNVNPTYTNASSKYGNSSFYRPAYQTTQVSGYQPALAGQARPLMVRPGDPRLGGVVCGECRGSGRIRFFLDEDLCPLCGGIGRIVPNNGARVTY
ncbi:hypothetical protein Kpol_513p18 [Vanderwaltozyma polyspora DSM 70294]|uniref:Uncharacterized protein n=1 Tax=Vanderwaltozyma polyspora (strain ATCC 22028 / DSM 70294 / BCRC 21397 / CBS 2163 / NBRC 10782 / NRRL Y-8283 / UCD 57-17) TaxID=436907 RepID=A7TMK4_VANPO|nr:uncharacterized protein Kpol_513p18 [Vanderwaltozyma polyspora DSM 70294]EDO16502.1 hypothetical protein Kpol_513p18 [Vanderwaltozyma polyspora DSM 70294]